MVSKATEQDKEFEKTSMMNRAGLLIVVQYGTQHMTHCLNRRNVRPLINSNNPHNSTRGSDIEFEH